MTVLLHVDNLSTHFKLRDGQVARAVDNVSFRVASAETVCIVGESGCGKSVCAYSIMQLLPRQAYHPTGRILFRGNDVLRMPVEARRQFRGAQAAMIFQEPASSLNPVYPVGKQVAEALLLHGTVNRSQARQRVLRLFEEVGIPDPPARWRAFPHELSGGMKQRVMIAMALGCNPHLLIADEPTTALDVTISAQILQLLSRLQRERQMAVLMITHDLQVVRQVADWVVVMYAGRVVETATRAQLFARPAHPYTRALLGAIPTVNARGNRLSEIPGRVPPATAFASHCRFANRCANAFDPCRLNTPGFTEIETGHLVACYLSGEIDAPHS